MQHDNEKPRRRRRIAQGKGYYIALALCVAAVGISGYVFFRAARNSQQTQDAAQAALSVPVVPENETAQGGETPQTGETAAVNEAPGTTPTPTPTPAPSADGAVAQTPTAEPVLPDAAQAAALLETLEDAAAELDLSDAQLCWPVSGLVTDTYSMEALVYNATMGDWRVHEGVDISAEAGSQVLCACAGTVTAVYADDLLGTVVVVNHGGGYETRYANLAEATLVNAGQQVDAGTPLGYIGTTALAETSEEPHLHLEVYCNGFLMDPVDFLP